MDIKIDCHNKDGEEVREIIARQLAFPEYYGKNWDAFLDCMRDLSWINEGTLCIRLENYNPSDSDELLTSLSYSTFWWQNEVSQQQLELLGRKTLQIILC